MLQGQMQGTNALNGNIETDAKNESIFWEKLVPP